MPGMGTLAMGNVGVFMDFMITITIVSDQLASSMIVLYSNLIDYRNYMHMDFSTPRSMKFKERVCLINETWGISNSFTSKKAPPPPPPRICP